MDLFSGISSSPKLLFLFCRRRMKMWTRRLRNRKCIRMPNSGSFTAGQSLFWRQKSSRMSAKRRNSDGWGKSWRGQNCVHGNFTLYNQMCMISYWEKLIWICSSVLLRLPCPRHSKPLSKTRKPFFVMSYPTPRMLASRLAVLCSFFAVLFNGWGKEKTMWSCLQTHLISKEVSDVTWIVISENLF